MKYLRVPLTDKAFIQLLTEAKKKGVNPAALASTKISMHPKG